MQETYPIMNKKRERVLIDTSSPFSKQEIKSMIIAVLLTTIIVLFPSLNIIRALIALVTVLIIFPLTFFIKKKAGIDHSIQIEHSFWKLSRFGFKIKAHTQKPMPMGIILPLIITVISWGYLNPLTFFQLDAENMTARRLLKAKGYRRGLRKELINEADFAFTASYAMYAILAYAIVMYILTLFTNVSLFVDSAFYALAFGAWNLIPVSQLDGAKIFFGSFITWVILVFLFIGMFILLPFF